MKKILVQLGLKTHFLPDSLYPKIGFLGTQNQPKMGFKQVEQGFSSFVVKFLPYLMIFQSSIAPLEVCSILKDHQIWPKFDKNEEKPC